MTKSRKRILLSSIAMLLVALVALGSATFAWFTINKSVDAKAMTVKAATANGLQITIDNGANWGREFSYNDFATATDNVLTPVSFQYATGAALGSEGFYPADAKVEGAYTSANVNTNGTGWAAQSVVSSPTATLNNGDAKASNHYFAAYRLGVRSSNEAIPNVTMALSYADKTGDSQSAGDFIRFVVVDETTNKIVACKGDGAASTYPVASVTSGAATLDTTAQAADVTSVTGITAPALSSTAQYYTVYVWFEGQDAQCLDNHQAMTGTLNVNFSF